MAKSVYTFGMYKFLSRQCLDLDLLLVCKQVYHEAFPVFYSTNTFSISGNIIPDFVEAVGPDACVHVRALFLTASMKDIPEWNELWGQYSSLGHWFPGLRQVRVNVELEGMLIGRSDLGKIVRADFIAALMRGGLSIYVNVN